MYCFKKKSTLFYYLKSLNALGHYQVILVKLIKVVHRKAKEKEKKVNSI